MGDHEAVNLRRRGQLPRVVALMHNLEEAVKLGMIPEGWRCRWCVEAAASEIRNALDDPATRTGRRGERDDPRVR
ncbi:MAG: hypothetical protein JWN54_3693 [Mycobacterium sp.]|nr:hypothetical protein [Mycobacterium sp.]